MPSTSSSSYRETSKEALPPPAAERPSTFDKLESDLRALQDRLQSHKSRLHEELMELDRTLGVAQTTLSGIESWQEGSMTSGQSYVVQRVQAGSSSRGLVSVMDGVLPASSAPAPTISSVDRRTGRFVTPASMDGLSSGILSNSMTTMQSAQTYPDTPRSIDGGAALPWTQKYLSAIHEEEVQRAQQRVVQQLTERFRVPSPDCSVSSLEVHTALLELGFKKYRLREIDNLFAFLQGCHRRNLKSSWAQGSWSRDRVKQQYPGSTQLELTYFATCLAKAQRSWDNSISFLVSTVFRRNGYDKPTLDRIEMLCVMREVLLSGDAIAMIANLMDISMEAILLPERTSPLMLLEPIVGAAILVNGILLGLQLDFDLDDNFTMFLVEQAFIVFFIMEMVIKVFYSGFQEHFLGSNRYWNAFDGVLVITALFDTVVQLVAWTLSFDTRSFTLVKVVRLSRLWRLFRLCEFQSLTELSMMVRGLLSGLRTLFWALLLLVLMIYVLGVAITLMAEGGNRDLIEDKLFTSVPRSMLTIFRCYVHECTTSTGQPIIYFLIEEHGVPFAIGYVLTTMVVTFGLFNLIVAVYVDTTLEASRHSDEMERHRQAIRTALKVKQVLHKFCDAQKHGYSAVRARSSTAMEACKSYWTLSPGGRGSDRKLQHGRDSQQGKDLAFEGIDLSVAISKVLFMKVVQDPKVKMLMDDVGIPLDRSALFDSIDAHGSGVVQMQSLLKGLMMVRGQARQRDVVATLLTVRAVQGMLRGVERTVLSIKEEVGDLHCPAATTIRV